MAAGSGTVDTFIITTTSNLDAVRGRQHFRQNPLRQYVEYNYKFELRLAVIIHKKVPKTFECQPSNTLLLILILSSTPIFIYNVIVGRLKALYQGGF